MHADFSEFSYGYTVTEELITKHRGIVIGAPRFPSLYEEGKKGGYDVKIPLRGKPVFLQFKLSDYLERSNAKEHKNGTLTVPYYRMHLRSARHSDQHQLLFDLEASGESVFYIAPEFHLTSELNSHYLSNQVVTNSAAFSPSAIGPLPDLDSHYIVFHKWASHSHLCSDEAIQVSKTSLEGGLLHALTARNAPERDLGEEGLKAISDKLLEILESREVTSSLEGRRRDVGGIREIVGSRSTIESIGYMSRTFFSSELVVLPSEL